MHRNTAARTSAQILVILAVTLMLAGMAAANVAGAIFTTTSDGQTVNGNIYASKADVYLNGGPQNNHDPGLTDGTYYFQVTDPSGSILLSLDDISCRQVVVSGGRITGVPASPACQHNLGTLNPANGEQPVQLCNPDPTKCATDFADTPNPGGEYKAWLTPVANYSLDGSKCSTPSRVSFGFCDADSKTDNFKVKKANVAYISVCKFNDLDANGLQGPGEPLIPFWPINASGVDTQSGPLGTVNTQTDATGCVSLSVSTFDPNTGTDTATLTESLLNSSWTETAPLDGAYDANGAAGCTTNCPTSVSSFTQTITVKPGDTITAPNFGNTCVNFDQNTGCGGNTIQLTVTKNANPSFTRTFTWGITKSVDNTKVFTAGGAPATFNYTVSVTHDNGIDSAWMVTGTIYISNSSLVAVNGVNVADAVDNGGTCTVTGGTNITIPASSQVQVPYVCTYSAQPANGTNTATATAPEGQFTGTASINFNGATINVVDGTVTVTDTLGGTLGTVSYTDPSPTTFTYSKTFTDPAGTCTSHDNTATFTTNTTSSTGSASQTVTDCQGANLTVIKTAAATFNSNITKSVDKTEIDTSSGTNVTLNYTVKVTTSGWAVGGNITVTNPNDFEAVTVNLADALSDVGGSCTITGGNTQTVAASSSISPAYNCTFAAVPGSSSGTNTATATWDSTAAHTTNGSASGSAGYTFGSLTITDTFNGTTTTLGTVTIPPGTATYMYSHTVPAPAGTCATYNNTAKIVETSQTAGQSVKVCGAVPLTVTKNATPSFNSSIAKSVDKTKVQQSGGSVTFNYTVTVTESGWNVAGTITVTNPNDWESITAAVTDALTDAGGACTVTGGSSVVVAASSTSTLPYSCSFAARPTAVSGTNTATATWNAAAAHTAAGTASGTAGYTFATLTVTDNVQSSANPGGCNATLGTVSVTTTTPSGSPGCGLTVTSPSWGVFKYSITDTNANPGVCASYNNTASIPGSSASVTVTVCNTNTGALTMGFWKNTNGQKIITSYCSGTSGISLHAYLTSFNPFKDDTATSCSGEASYVNKIIGAATCGGSTCNPMLKAQMLATALDVYFSDPTLGGNRIGGFNGLGSKQPALGGVAIDLTHICAMIDGSNSSSCSGSFEDVRPEFGIANSCTGATVGTMLSYSNFSSIPNGSPVSNIGGTTWYKQIKNPNQVYAKDGFDNVNNQVANIAPSGVCTSTF